MPDLTPTLIHDSADPEGLPRAAALATRRKSRFANESLSYAVARQDLLTAEIRLQRQLDAVAAQRAALPEGPLVEKDYRFVGPNGGESGLSDLFGVHDTLVTYFWMYGPERQRPCPMCTNLLGPLDANATDLKQRVAIAVLGRSPVERQIAFKIERGWRNLDFYQTVSDDYAVDLGGLDPTTGSENPVLAVYRKDGEDGVRLFWMGEMSGEMADRGKDPRGGPDLAPLWTVLDLTPGGRGTDWYPRLSY